MGNVLCTCERTISAKSTPSPRRRVASRGNAMMPLLYSLGQHRALEDVARHLLPGEHLFAFLDDTFVVSFLRCLCGGMRALESTWARHKCGIGAGNRPAVCDRLERAAQIVNPGAHRATGD